MIQDLSQTLKAILTQSGLPTPLSSAQIAFDRPTETFAPTTPAIDLFLYDLRENLELRNNEPIIKRSNGQVTITQPGFTTSLEVPDDSTVIPQEQLGGAGTPATDDRLAPGRS